MKKFSYEIKNRLTFRNQFVIDFCGQVKGKKILDVGCSFGWLEKALLAKGVKEIVGIEPKEELFYNAKKEVPEAKFVIGSALNIPFSDYTFDQVIFLEVLEHLPKGTEKKTFAEISRVLKKRGSLIMSVPNYHFFSCFLDQAWYIGHRHYSLDYLKESLVNNNLSIKTIFFYGGFWELLRMTSHYFFKWVLRGEDPLKDFFNSKIKDDGYRKDGFAYIYLKAIKK